MMQVPVPQAARRRMQPSSRAVFGEVVGGRWQHCAPREVGLPCEHATEGTEMTNQPYRAVFFDLDGTLLPMDVNAFMKTYFHALGAYVARFGVVPDAFMAGMKTGIMNMVQHDDGTPNDQAFWAGFFAHVDETACDWPVEIARFYEDEFGAIGADVQPNPAAARAINALAAKGYPLVLATMPMFPRRAVEWRLTWAGVDPNAFSRITTFENSTSVKPKPAYYAENLAAAGLAGADVLMVGNNTKEDLAACALGAAGYLVTDFLLNPADLDVETVPHGTLEDFADWAEQLPVCTNPATGIADALVPAAAREAALAAAGIAPDQAGAGGARTLTDAAKSGGASETFKINGMGD